MSVNSARAAIVQSRIGSYTGELCRPLNFVRLSAWSILAGFRFNRIFATAESISDQVGHKLKNRSRLDERAAGFVQGEVNGNFADGQPGFACSNHDLGVGEPVV